MADQEDDLRQAVAEAVSKYDLSESDAWSDLDELSTHTRVEQVEVDPDGVVVSGDTFSGVANVYVTLQFGRDDEEGFHEGESFLGHFDGAFHDGKAVVERFSINTSSGFEEAEG
ncbi:MAG: hypothetical protein JOZ90_05510 [Alphaproteobacteria bacterium]|nr:hypothetical protein [Alphaproteobacteria bacterium]MBV9371840.1 hypothetical protein [Alphaproteobacteria bacterium]MBV9900538.1 hypothetical protein [Alphaproteobacteria bacterium]